MSVVLDAWAVVAYLMDQPAAARVEEAISSQDAVVSDINLGEALYSIARGLSADRSVDIVQSFRREVRAEKATWELTMRAARLKARHRISYADGFAIATAQRHEAPLYTGDPEILEIDAAVETVNLREDGASSG